MNKTTSQISDSFVSKKIQFIKEAWNEHLWVRLLLIFTAIILSALLIFLLIKLIQLIIPLLKLKIEFKYDYLVDTFNNNPFLQKNELHDLLGSSDALNKIEKLLEFEIFQPIILFIQENDKFVTKINLINTTPSLQLKLKNKTDLINDDSNQNLNNLKTLIGNIPDISKYKNIILQCDIENFHTKSTKERNQLFSSLEVQFDDLHQAISDSFKLILKLEKTRDNNEDKGYNNLLEEVQNTIKIWVNAAINFYAQKIIVKANDIDSNPNKPFNEQFEKELEKYFPDSNNNSTTVKINQQSYNNKSVNQDQINQNSDLSIYDDKPINHEVKKEGDNNDIKHSNKALNPNTLFTINKENEQTYQSRNSSNNTYQSQNSSNNNLSEEPKVKITPTIETPEVNTVQEVATPFKAELTDDDNSILEKFNNIQQDQIDNNFTQKIIKNIMHLMQSIINGSIGTMSDSHPKLYDKINPLIEKYNLHNINNCLEILNDPETIKIEINNIILFTKNIKHHLSLNTGSQIIKNLNEQLDKLNDQIKTLSEDINLSNEEKITNLILNDLNDQDRADIVTKTAEQNCMLNYNNCNVILNTLNDIKSKNENNIPYKEKIDKLIQIVQDYSNNSKEMKLSAEIKTLNSALEIRKNTILNDIGKIKFDEYQLLWSEQSKKLITKIKDDQNNLNELNKTIHNIIYNLNEIQNPANMLNSIPGRNKKVELPALFIRKNNNDFPEKNELNILITQLQNLNKEISETIQLEKQIYDKSTELENLKTPNNEINILRKFFKGFEKQ